MKHQFPEMVEYQKEQDYNFRARLYVGQFEKFILPILSSLGLYDDEHIKKYLLCDTLEPIYRDAVAEQPERVRFIENEREIKQLDSWKQFRDANSEVKHPSEPGFIFAKMPCGISEELKNIKTCLYVEKRKIRIDKGKIQDLCIVRPTDIQLAVYELVAEFCEKLEELGERKKMPQQLFNSPKEGLSPNVCGIVGRLWLTKKK